MSANMEKKESSACGCGGGSCCGGPGKWIWIALAVAVAGVLVARNASRKPACASPASVEMPAAVEPGAAPTPAPERVASGKALPRLVDLGADKCQACKMMMPVLDGLKKDHADAFVTEFIDVWENPEEAKKYNVRLIPTQVFLDASGGELFRHEGFFGKDDILAKWQELGVELGAGEQSE